MSEEKQNPKFPETRLTDADLQPYIGSLLMQVIQLTKENKILREALDKKAVTTDAGE